MPTFSEPFTGGIRTYWDQYVGVWTANGANITSGANGTRYLRLAYRIGDQSADGDVSVLVVTKGAGTGKSGVYARGSDNAADLGFDCIAAVYDATAATIKIVRFTTGVPSTLEDTLIDLANGDTIGLRMTTVTGVTTLRALKNGVAIGTGVVYSTLTSGHMGIIDIDGHTYDDFSGPTTAQTAVHAWRITHYNGSTTDYDAIMSSDRARGKALADALTNAVPGDRIDDISTAHTHDTGGLALAAAAGTVDALLKLVEIRGVGKTTTVVYSQTHNLTGACFTPNLNQVLRDLWLRQNTGQTNGSPIGHRANTPAAGSIPAEASGDYSNVLIQDVRSDGPIDCYHTTGGATRVFTGIHLVRCDLNSSFDSFIVVNNSCDTGSTITATNCTGTGVYPHPLYPAISAGAGATTRAVSCQDASCVMTVYGGTWTVGGASAVNSAALVTNGTLNLFDCALIATGTNALSIQRTGGTLNYSNVTLTGATSGTITGLGAAYAPGPPTDLFAGSGNGSAWLTWTRNAVNDNGNTLEWATDAIFTTGTASASLGAGVTLGKATGLTNNTRYYFRVKATNATGSSIYSNIATAVPRNLSPAGRSGGGGGSSFGRGRRVLRTTRH